MSRATPFNLCDYLLGDARLAAIGEHTAIAYRGDRITYAELRRLVDAWAARLLEHGTREGDRVALLLYDSPIFIAAFLAGACIGAVSVPINTALAAEDIRFIIADSGARLIICETELQGKLGWAETGEKNLPAVCLVDGRRRVREEINERNERVDCARTCDD